MATRLPTLTWRWWVAFSCAALILGLIIWYVVGRGNPVIHQAVGSHPKGDGVLVEVTTPRPGGIDRICQQPGSIEPIEGADLFTKVSGILTELNVDIGHRVKKDDVLARIAVPDHETQVVQDAAEVTRAEAKVEQMTAAIETAQADLGAASAGIALAEAEKQSKVSFRAYREKQRDRIQELVSRDALAAKTLDEQMDYYQSAVGADLAAGEAVNAAKQKEAAAKAKVAQAKADLKVAQAEVATANARLERSKVFVEFAVIRSPYTGVVTKRNYHRGDFIRSADTGGDRIPVLVVERTDVMRVVVQVPERDVPFVDRGDPAVVDVDALPGFTFKTQGKETVEVSLLASSEDPHTRMMRTEVHVNNSDGKLRRGMFGRVTITLQPGAEGALRIPSAALVGKAHGGKGSVRVVRNGKAVILPVRYGTDNGSDVEVLSGLEPSDRVIVRAIGHLEEGTTVTISDKKLPAGGH